MLLKKFWRWSQMKFKEKQKNKKTFHRFLVGLILLLLLGGVAFYGIFKNIDIRKPTFFKKELIIPVPSNDPLKELESRLSRENIPINFPLMATESGISATLSEGGQIIFSREKDFNSQVDSLQIILSRLKIEGKKVKKVDFRFDKPVVVY